MLKLDVHVLLNSLNVWLIISLVLVLFSCSSTKPITYKQFQIAESNSFLPREFREVLDSTEGNKDYLDQKLKIYFPDTLPDSSLYSPDAPIFKPFPNDSGIVLCERDMALYVKDRETVKYLKTEIESRKKISTEIIQGAMEAEQLYRTTLKESNQYNKTIYDAYRDERENSNLWRNIALFSMAFAGGYIINEYVSYGQ
jgi:hypothetical protein